MTGRIGRAESTASAQMVKVQLFCLTTLGDTVGCGEVSCILGLVRLEPASPWEDSCLSRDGHQASVMLASPA